jgi:dihydropteroate synthase
VALISRLELLPVPGSTDAPQQPDTAGLTGTPAPIGAPVLIGASRKRFLGSLLAGPDSAPAPVEDRDAATAAISTLAALAGVWCVRVHAVRPSADAVRVVGAIRSVRSPEPVASAKTRYVESARMPG